MNGSDAAEEERNRELEEETTWKSSLREIEAAFNYASKSRVPAIELTRRFSITLPEAQIVLRAIRMLEEKLRGKAV